MFRYCCAHIGTTHLDSLGGNRSHDMNFMKWTRITASMKIKFLDDFTAFHQEGKMEIRTEKGRKPNENNWKKRKNKRNNTGRREKLHQLRTYRSTRFTPSFKHTVTLINATAEFTGWFKALEGFIELSLGQITIHPAAFWRTVLGNTGKW